MLVPNSTVINDNSLLGHAILHCMPEDFDHKKSLEKGGVEVIFQLDGRETNIQAFFDHVEKQLDRMVREKAAEMVREKLHPLMNTLSRLDDGMRKVVELMDENDIY